MFDEIIGTVLDTELAGTLDENIITAIIEGGVGTILTRNYSGSVSIPNTLVIRFPDGSITDLGNNTAEIDFLEDINLTDLKDVTITNPQNGQLINYNSTSGEWENISLSGLPNTGFTQGSVIFQGATGLDEDNTNFFWDNVLKRLGLGTASPEEPLHIYGALGGTGLKIESTNGAGIRFSRGAVSNSAPFAFATNDVVKFSMGLANNGTDNFYIGDTPAFANKFMTIHEADGSALFQNSVDSTTAFQILDSLGALGYVFDSTQNYHGFGVQPIRVVHAYTESDSVLALFQSNAANGLLVDWESVQNTDAAFRLQGASNWTQGVDNSLSGSYVIAWGNTFPSNIADNAKAIKINTSGHIQFQNRVNSASGFTFEDASGNAVGIINTSTPAIETSGNFKFPSTTATTGIFYKDGSRFLHSYGNNNLFLGEGSGNFTTSGTGLNVAVGFSTLPVITTGQRNMAVGGLALDSNTEGSFNSAIGYAALGQNETGNSNTAIGYRAGNGAASGNISNNVLIGYFAGIALDTGGNNNIIVGYRAGENITTGSNNLIIGHQLSADSTTVDYQFKLSQAFYGSINPAGENFRFQPTVDTTTFLQVLNAAGTPITNVDTVNKRFSVKNLNVLGSKAEKVTVVNAATYSMLTTDRVLVVDYTATGAVALTLPSASSSFDSTDNTGIVFLIKDSGANANTYNITINRSGSDTIIDSATGQTSTLISTNGGAIWIQAKSATEWIVY